MNALLEVEDLGFSHPDRCVLSGWQARLGGGLHWLRGPNGSGKSTLLRLLAGVLEPSRGERRLAGHCARREPLAYRRELFWCGPERLGFDHLRVDEFFGFLRTLYPRASLADWARACAGLGLTPAIRAQRLAALSSGTQRKAWVAAGLASGTTALLLDEPWNALDAAAAAWLHAEAEACAQAAGPRLWLVASHLPPCAAPQSVLELRG